MTITQNHPQLEQALPSDVSIQSDTWITRYRNYPVFSRTWFKHRIIAFGITTLFVLAIISAVVFLKSDDAFNLLVLDISGLFVGGFSLLAIGQSMAVWIKQRQYSPRKESILISCAIVLGIILSIGAVTGTEYTMKKIFPKEAQAQKQKEDKLLKERLERKEKADKEKLANTEENIAGNENKVKTQDSRLLNESITSFFSLILTYLPTSLIVLYQGSAFDLFIFFRQRKRLAESLRLQELKQAQEARREAELRLSVLVAQVEPHFLFNTLAGVRSAILTDPLRATVIVDHLVDYLRSTIPNMRDDGTSNQGRLAQQLEAAKAYLGLMKARIPRLSFEVTSDIKDAAIPPLILISLVENAIKHGIEPKIGPAHIEVSAKIIGQEDEEFLEISVKDNGVGFGGTTSGGGIGLSNIRERLESTYGKNANLTLKAQPEGGVNAIIVLPLAI